jgi:hypothetical protein
MKWDKRHTEGETDYLMETVYNGWAWKWPGFGWIAKIINIEFNNNRSANACRHKFNRQKVLDLNNIDNKGV